MQKATFFGPGTPLAGSSKLDVSATETGFSLRIDADGTPARIYLTVDQCKALETFLLQHSLREHLGTEPPEGSLVQYSHSVMYRAFERVLKAVKLYPQPNYVLTKVAEEAGEVVKAGVHLSEGRDFSLHDLENECIDTIAMCLRLLIEGDQIHGVPSFFETDAGKETSDG